MIQLGTIIQLMNVYMYCGTGWRVGAAKELNLPLPLEGSQWRMPKTEYQDVAIYSCYLET